MSVVVKSNASGPLLEGDLVRGVVVVAGHGVYFPGPAGAYGRVSPLLQVQKFVGISSELSEYVPEQDRLAKLLLLDTTLVVGGPVVEGTTGKVGVASCTRDAAVKSTIPTARAMTGTVSILYQD
jgi:hypothetical protein